MTNKRRISELLPEVLQTDILRKFLAATGDHLFQPGNVSYVNGFIGNKPSYAQESDVYVQEPSRIREAYQVSSTAVSANPETGEITHTLFYEDLINKLRFQGALVDDHNRLFAAEYYSWGAPFDLDKWLNFINYVWLPEGPDRITLLSETNVTQIQGVTTYEYQGAWQTQSQEGTSEQNQGGLTFSTGMKIRFSADVNPDVRNIDYIVEGVGRSIRLIPDNYLSSLAWDNPPEWDSAVWDTSSLSLIPTYVTIARGAANGNPWSVGNRWFHRDVVLQSGTDESSIQGARAQRPILEMDAQIRLWNMGTRSRGYVNVVDSCTTSLDQILGQREYIVYENCDRTGSGVLLDDNMRILFTNLKDPQNPNAQDTNLNNKIYTVTNIRSGGTIALEVVSNGSDVTGAPVEGDCVLVLQGDTSKLRIQDSNINSSWYYTQGTWKKGQSRQTPNVAEPTTAQLAFWNQAPLFELFDSRGNSLADPAIYPNSSFTGCSLVQYTQLAQGVLDPYLGFPAAYQDVSPTNFLFNVTLETDQITFVQNTVSTPIPGMRFYQTQDYTNNTVYLNMWYASSELSRQYVVNEFWSTGSDTEYLVDQAPDLQAAAPPAVTVEVAGERYNLNQQYTVLGDVIKLNTPPPAGVLVKVRTWGGLHNTVKQGYFEQPRNLTCNPLNSPVTQFSRSDLVSHVKSILENQAGFTGDSVGSNNWRDTAQDQSLGTEILQHRASLIKLMVLNSPAADRVFESSNTPVDPFVSVQWAQNEYLRFYNKVINTLVNLYNKQAYTGIEPAQQWLTTALNQVNVGKTRNSAWANSGIEFPDGMYCSQSSTQPTWVPVSATRLGVTPAWIPEAFVDSSQPGSPLCLRCHNGAIVVLKDLQGNTLGTISTGATSTTDVAALSHPVARAWLLFEQRIYQSMPVMYQDVERTLPLDPRSLFSGKYRKTSYTTQDRNRLLAPAFEKWCAFNQVDAMRNTQFDLADPYTWNYSNCLDLDGDPVPGHWRGMYFHFYDTDSPHIHPWQMLGFANKPSWWDAEYGAAPYTSGNTRMWNDLEQGRIAQGPRAGIHATWSRPGLSRCLPVDASGNLLTPNLTGMLATLPSAVEASADWKFGDRSPMENVWLTTVDSDFVWATVMYQARPVQMIDYLWDGAREVQLFGNQRYSQWVNSQNLQRTGLTETLVHREDPQQVLDSPDSDATYYGSCGIQHWISEKLVSENLNVTRYLGDLIRGAQVQLGHKMGSFVNASSLRVLVDSFGIGNSNSLLLPQEDVSVELLRTPSVKESFYTGVIVEYRGSQVGWRIIGYDSVDPYFTIVPSNTKGIKNTVVIGNQRVIEYSQGLNTTQRVAYGTVFKTRQEVYDMLISLGRHQQSEGWIFDQFDEAAGRMRDWSQSAREFLFWSQGPWSAGTYITLSPLATLAKYRTEFGIIQSVGQLVNGTYSVLDRSGVSISLKDLDMLRIDDEISVRVLNDQGLYGVRLYVTSMEHALLFRNETIFGDLIYNPVLNQRQSRFRLLGYKSESWQGRLDAPGYMVTQSVQVLGDDVVINNRIIPNFEKSVEDLRKLFEIDPSTAYKFANDASTQVSTITQSVEPRLNQMATHLVGYQDRSYLTDLLVDRTVAFQFYQGMIQQKGTSESIQRLLRNTTVLSLDQDLQIFEEFAFRNAYYGANDQIYQVDIQLIENQVVSDPQQVEFTGNITQDDPRDQKISIVARDARKINSTLELPPFKLRTHYGAAPEDLPTAGYVLLDEVNYTVKDTDQLLQLYTNQQELSFTSDTDVELKKGDRVWQFMHPLRGWDVFKLSVPVWRLLFTEPSQFDTFSTTVRTSAAHGLQVGDMVIIFGVLNAGASINNTFQVQNVTETTFDISITTTNQGSGGTIWVYRSVRFSSWEQLNLPSNQGLIEYKELAYVDGSDTMPWVVYRKGSTSFFAHRTEQLRVDTRLLLGSRLYSLDTLQTRNLLTLWDPIKNQLPGVFSREITYKTPYDPAQYTQDPTGTYGINASAAWGEAQVGLVWWDLSTTRFLEYEIGSDSYRRKHWGSIAPGTSIDVYEWVRSTVPPASWSSLVAQGANLQSIGSNYSANGSVRSIDAPYVTGRLINSTGQTQTVYYFWVRNMITVPDVPGRSISTQQLSNLLSNPQNSGIRWWSALNSTSVLVGGVASDLDGKNVVLQIKYTHSTNLMNGHKQYDLIRPGDPQSSPNVDIWLKLKHSLVEFNAVGDSVPDLRLPEMQKLGVLIRPSQSMFNRSDQAREAFITSVNNLILSADKPVTTDPSRSGWGQSFTSAEAPPARNNNVDPVELASQPRVVETNRLSTQFSNQLQIIETNQSKLISVNWVVEGPGLDQPARVTSVSINLGLITIEISAFLQIEQSSTYVFSATHSYYQPGDQTTPSKLLVSHYSSEPLIPGSWDPFLIDGVPVSLNDRVLFKDQAHAYENGIYQLTSIQDLGVRNTNGLVGYYVFTRAVDMRSNTQNLYLIQTKVLQGVTQANTIWYQSNENVLELDVSDITFIQGEAPQTWVRDVPTIAARNALNFQLNFGSQVLVYANPETQNRWTIWRWDRVSAGEGTWTLVRVQGYNTPDAWTYEDWYAPGYSDNTVITYTFDTLFARDQFLDAQPGDVAKVLNTGNGAWALYVREIDSWESVGVQNANILLSDRLWNYNKYQMGFDGGGFDSTGQGYEYDSRLELDQIINGLWQPLTNSGFLLQNNEQNQPNQILFVMVNHVLAEQVFVDWVFKTSFINLRGFSDELLATPYYTSNKRESLVAYVNEVKPYHVKIRDFVDTRRALSTWNNQSTDFDKPPYSDPNPGQGTRILNENNVVDQVVLASSNEYKNWYLNYQTQPELIRKIKTTLMFDRVACAPLVEYAAGYDENSVLDNTVPTLVELYDLTPGNEVTSGYLVRVDDDGFGTWAWYVRNQTPYVSNTVSLCWTRVAFEHDQGSVNRIQKYYTPTVDQIPADSPLLISGCAGDLTTLDGSQFSIEDAWDQTVWDNIRGWSYSGIGLDLQEQNFQGGTAPQYITLKGTGSDTHFSLPWAPQDPNQIKIWVAGVIQQQGLDYVIPNQVGAVLPGLGGVGYSINDMLVVQGGVASEPAVLKVTQINPLGAITQLTLENPGVYDQIPLNPTPVTGGSGTGATVLCRWAGKVIQFMTPPPLAKKGANIWIVESGSTFNPAVSSVLDVIMDGHGLNRPHESPGHPEELVTTRLRNSLILDVYTQASAGWGAVLTRTYEADGFSTQFDIGQSVWAASQLWVYVAGRLQNYGEHYVVNMEYMRVVFTTAPATGVISILSVAPGGASRSMGTFTILNSGQDYTLGDLIQMEGGTPTITSVRVQVSAVTAVGISVSQGGANYQPGDTLYYRYGAATETLSLRVLNVTSTGGTRGIITNVEIITPGYYTSLTSDVNEWFTTGFGSGAEFSISWGIAQVFPVDRGIYYQEPQLLVQNVVLPAPGSSGLGTGLVIRMLPGAVRETAVLVGDGVSNEITLSKPAYLDTVLVTLNGERTFDYTFDGEDPRKIGLTFVPAPDDVVIVAVFDSSLFSLNGDERWQISGGELTRTLVNPPGYSPAQSLNAQVYCNQVKLRAPQYWVSTGDGSQTQFTLSFTPTAATDITVWLNNQLLNPVLFTVVGDQLQFLYAPADGERITVQYADPVTQNYDYLIENDQITFSSWAVTDGDQIRVMAFTEDSHTSWVNDTWPGDPLGVYVLSSTPAGFGSIQFFVDGLLLNQMWDYQVVVLNGTTQVHVSALYSLNSTNTVEARYPTAEPSKPPVAFRLFQNIYDETQYLRLSDANETRLAEDLLVDSNSVLVRDSSMLAPATPEQPGAVWIGAERVEYQGIELDPTEQLPQAARLLNLRRGTLGTPSGAITRYNQVFHNGDGSRSLFEITWSVADSALVVTVDGVQQVQGDETDALANYVVVVNPPSRIPGIYIQFWPERNIQGTTVQSSIPQPGNQNVLIIQKQESSQSGQLCYPANTLVRDATVNQLIPGGYRWPMGNKGIQFSAEPQTAFLLKQPGTRTV